MQLQQVPHCPSGEIYDMITDKKGFIWIAHNLGVSRYDGISFTNFSNPEQTAISMTDLVEDKYGRIWCHNFNGQIFYIQNDKMVSLKEYDFRNSYHYPRLILYGDEVVATCEKGFFVCNTATLQCRYEKATNALNPSTRDLCLVNDGVLGYNSDAWFVYKKNEGVSYLNNGPLIGKNSVKLLSRSKGDTVFAVDFLENTFYGLQIKDKQITVVSRRPLRAFFNTLSLLEGKIWINTKTSSFPLDQTDSIPGYNLTSMVTDNEGNKWFGSLSKGLLVTYKTTGWKVIPQIGIKENDYIKYVQYQGNNFIMISQLGRTIIQNLPPGKLGVEKIDSIPSNSGTTENMQVSDGVNYFIETSKDLYLLNSITGRIKLLEKLNIKDIALNGNKAYVATSAGVMVQPNRGWGLNDKGFPNADFSVNPNFLKTNIFHDTALKNLYRSRAVLFDTVTKSLLVSFADGLERVDGKQMAYIIYKKKRLYVSSMIHYGKKIYAGTFNNGLFRIFGDSLTGLESGVGPSIDAIVRLKICNKHLWIFRAHDVEVLDAERDKFLSNLQNLPVDAPAITDVEEDSANIYIATIYGLYTLPIKESLQNVKANISLLYMLVNSNDTILSNGIALPSAKNNLLFRFEIPVYKNAERLHLKYRLLNGDKNATENEWYYTLDAQRDIQFNALKPGNYTLETIAIMDNEVVSTKTLQYNFVILPPWYNTWWFYSLLVISISVFFFVLYQYRLKQALKIERIRRKISSDLHDDIGSTLSSINVYSQLAKTGAGGSEYINNIQSNTVDIINNLDDLVWNINPRNDTIEHLLHRMQLFALPLFQEKNIEFNFRIKHHDKDAPVSPDIRAHIYMLFKEMVNNVIKHSSCSICNIYFIQKGRAVRLMVKDNGKGFDIQIINRHRNGLYNMQQRVKDLNGTIAINSSPGNGTEIKIDCRIK
jgi:signal transduction histidine kinase